MYRYSGIQRLLHWLIALMVVGLLASGLFIMFLGFDKLTAMLGDERRDVLYEYHKTFGLIVLALMAIRLFFRFEHGKPPYPHDFPIAERALAAVVQYLMYLALFAQPILGWLATDAHDFPVEFFSWNIPQFITKDKAMGDALYQAHEWLGITLVILVIMHVAGGVKHWMFDGSGILRRMRPY